MTLAKMSKILTAYAVSLGEAGAVDSSRQLTQLAAALKKKGRMDVGTLSKIMKASG